MKKHVFLLLALVVLAFAAAGCGDTGNEPPDDIGNVQSDKEKEVEEYVDALRNDRYESYYLPAFTYEHIDGLLEYRDEKSIITKPPRNSMSSEYYEEYELGVYVLWTIEYIRIKHVDSSLLSVIGKFPSYNPIFVLKTSEELLFVFDAEAYQIASDAYYAWWAGRGEDLMETMKIDPLEDTEYRWY